MPSPGDSVRHRVCFSPKRSPTLERLMKRHVDLTGKRYTHDLEYNIALEKWLTTHVGSVPAVGSSTAVNSAVDSVLESSQMDHEQGSSLSPIRKKVSVN